jgi:hypothetical protein
MVCPMRSLQCPSDLNKANPRVDDCRPEYKRDFVTCSERCDELLTKYKGATAALSWLSHRLFDATVGHEVDALYKMWQEYRMLQSECGKLHGETLAHLQTHRTSGLR